MIYRTISDGLQSWFIHYSWNATCCFRTRMQHSLCSVSAATNHCLLLIAMTSIILQRILQLIIIEQNSAHYDWNATCCFHARVQCITWVFAVIGHCLLFIVMNTVTLLGALQLMFPYGLLLMPATEATCCSIVYLAYGNIQHK